jgi:predicted permease
MLAYDYPLLDVFVTIVFFILFVIWLFLLVLILADLFRDDEPSGLAKAVWCVFLILLPYIGVIAYIVLRGSGMSARELERARVRDEAFWSYFRDSSGMTPSGGALA